MRIAVITHIRHPIAPPFKGGMEAHAWHLSRELLRRGHDVEVFCAGDSDPTLPIRAIVDEHYDRTFPWHDFHGTAALNAHLDEGFAEAIGNIKEGHFDIVHNNSLHRYPPRFARVYRQPMVTSLHIPPFDALHRAVLESPAPWHPMTVTSKRQIEGWWGDEPPPNACVVPNGIALEDWPFVAKGDGTAVWSGRITPNKGTHLAVDVAKRTGVPLDLFGVIEDEDYFRAKVAVHLGPSIRYGGHLEGPELAAAMAKASVLLFTPLWDEPFGLVAIEAMACGLPIAATDRGAVREVIGPCGYYAPADDGAALARAMEAAMALPRLASRERVERLFSIERMVDDYENLYRLAADRQSIDFPDAIFPAIELQIAQWKSLPA